MTTTAGGRKAATEAGVTNFGAGGSTAGLGGGTGFAGVAEASSCASIEGAVLTGVAAGGFAKGRAGGCSTAPFCCVMARNTSPGREMWERSILVLISSST
jgi:hypothetical protein